MPVAPIVHSVSHVVQKDVSNTYLIPDVAYTHILVSPTVDVWVKPGGAGVVCAPGDTGATFVPARTMIELPSRRLLVDGITHLALYGPDKDGFLNLNYENAVITDTDCLIGIYHMLRQELIRVYGKPGYAPMPPPLKAHVDF